MRIDESYDDIWRFTVHCTHCMLPQSQTLQKGTSAHLKHTRMKCHISGMSQMPPRNKRMQTYWKNLKASMVPCSWKMFLMSSSDTFGLRKEGKIHVKVCKPLVLFHVHGIYRNSRFARGKRILTECWISGVWLKEEKCYDDS